MTGALLLACATVLARIILLACSCNPSYTLLPRSHKGADSEVCLVVNKYDTWGDGWNGAVYTITSSAGKVEATGTLSSEESESDEVCGLQIECYTMTVSAGEYPSEISWTITQEGYWLRGEGGAAATVGGICAQGMCIVIRPPHRQPSRPRGP